MNDGIEQRSAPRVEVVTIGTEILLGDIVDSNSAFVARALADAGIDVFAKHSVGDNVERIEAMLRGVLDRADGAVTTGGLGPTVDDLTREAVARVLGVDLVLHEDSLRKIERLFAAHGLSMSENNARQAYLPRGAEPLENPHGTAPGFLAFRADGKLIAATPGVPREMRAMVTQRLIPALSARYDLQSAIFTRTLHLVGINESEADRRIDDLFRSLENPKIAMLAHDGYVNVKIMAKARDRGSAEEMIAPIEQDVRARIGSWVFGVDDVSLPSAILSDLIDRNSSIVTAESITGGGIADAFVHVPGASQAFRGGVVAYDNVLKISLLDVPVDELREHGAVSEAVAHSMANGARERMGSDFALATTGIAGPTGGSPEKPVGLVWFALALPDGKIVTRRSVFPGDRDFVRRRAVVTALELLWRNLDVGRQLAISAAGNQSLREPLG
ncbi:MAG TPA: competence/damage-inducible protein A [Candidatus Baltobacteraceae bacterium]|jgi:nicotinamide-nucleotide amidase|nr:competence/damage-inducible protein A [Candidatus Baltobacteraceae bacterium]